MTAQAEREIGTPEESNVGHHVIIRSLLAVKDVLAIPESLLFGEGRGLRYTQAADP